MLFYLIYRIQEEDQIWLDDDVFVGELPDCNTLEMIKALNGKWTKQEFILYKGIVLCYF